MCGYSNFVGTCTQNLNFVGTQICGYSKFVAAQNLLIRKICGTKICGYSKFQVGGRENQNICVLCISCEQKNICAFPIYAFFHICKKHTV